MKLDMYYRESPGGLAIVNRQDFANNKFHCEPGDHVVFGGPSTKGKTRLAFDLLAPIATAENPAYVAQSKPRDKETALGAKRLHFREVSEWPPPPKIQEMKAFNGPPRGYLIKPKFGNIDTDMQNCARITARLLGDRYTAGVKGKKGILVMDDTMVKAKIMGLDHQMVTIIAMAGGMGIGEWVFIQKPTDSGRVTLWAFENAIHLFLTKGGDARMLERYAQIAGEHGPIVKEVVPKLGPYEFLYIHKYEGWICIIGKD